MRPTLSGPDKSFEELAKDGAGTIYEDTYENGVRYLIMRGPSALCAYVGIPADHPLAGYDYDDISIDCHGGLTFADEGGKRWPGGWYWYGWDYAHAGDKSFYDLRADMQKYARPNDREWVVEDVRKEIWHVTYQFSKLVRLAESIARKRGSA